MSPQAIRVIDFINSVNSIPTISEISFATGLSPSTVSRILSNLGKAGVRFGAVVELCRLGLIEVLLFYRGRVPATRVPRKLLRSFIKTLEGVTILRYVTKIHEVESVVNYVIDNVGLKPSEVYTVDYVVSPRYVLTHLARGTVDRIYLRELLLMSSSSQIPSKLPTIEHVDLIDIALVNRLEENIFTRIKEVYQELRSSTAPPSYQTILRHYKEHVLGRGVIAGVRPTLEEYVSRTTTAISKVLIFYGSPNALAKGIRAVLGIPIFSEAYMNVREGVAYTFSKIPLGLLPKVVEFLNVLESRNLVKEWGLLEIEPASYVKLPIPELLGARSVSELLTDT